MKADLFSALESALRENAPCVVVTDTESGEQVLLRDGGLLGDLSLTDDQLAWANQMVVRDVSGPLADTDLFARVYGPAPRMIIVGAVHIAQALAPMAHLAGFDVTVVDPREGFVKAGRLSDVTAVADWPDDAMAALAPDTRTAVVTLTHDPKLDDPALEAALKSPAFYIGSLGSTRTHAKRLQRLKGSGFSDNDVARIHGPIGLDIKAKTPSEIAVAILAQVIEARRNGTHQHSAR